MIVTRINLLEEFLEAHADARSPLETWLAEARASRWNGPSDIKARYQHASFLSDNRVVFNIKGNRYRLLVQIAYKTGVVWVMRVGTHEEYQGWKL